MPYAEPAKPLGDLEIINRWLLFHLSGATAAALIEERDRYGVDGNYLVGFAYADYEVGLSVDVEAFCNLSQQGQLVTTASPPAQKHMLKIRYESFKPLPFWFLEDAHIQALNLPAKPDWLVHYQQPLVEPTRQLSALNPLRAPGYPDDIKFLLRTPKGSGMQMEEVWGRIVQKRSEKENQILLECLLLVKPYQNFGLEKGNHVAVSVQIYPQGVMAICVGRVVSPTHVEIFE